MSEIVIEVVELKDAPRLLEIYAPYVLNTTVSFELSVPSLEEFEDRIATTLKKFPYFTAKIDGEICGYCYVSAFKSRAAYQWSVETSVYVDEKCKGQGIGRKLYEILEVVCRKMNILNMNACISYPNPGSISFHEKMGYEKVAHFNQIGYKFDSWIDMIWMEKSLGEHMHNPPEIVPFMDIKDELFD